MSSIGSGDILYPQFQQRKATAIRALYEDHHDKSPKGSIDAPILSLLNNINAHIDYMSTSSCSGRITLYEVHPNLHRKETNLNEDAYVADAAEGSTEPELDRRVMKGGYWHMIEHGAVTKEQVMDACDRASSSTAASSSATAVFRFEPLIIAIACSSLVSAQRLLTIVRDCGYSESGLSSLPLSVHGKSLSLSRPVILSVRSSIRMETTIIKNGSLLVSEAYLDELINEANGKWSENCARFNKLEKTILERLHTQQLPGDNSLLSSPSDENQTDSLPGSNSEISTQPFSTPMTEKLQSQNPGSSSLNNWIITMPKRCTKVFRDAMRKRDWSDLSRRVTALQRKTAEEEEFMMIPINSEAIHSIQQLCASDDSAYTMSSALIRLLELENQISEESFPFIQLKQLIGDDQKSVVIAVAKTSSKVRLEETISIQLQEHSLPKTLMKEVPAKWEMLGDLVLLPPDAFVDPSWESLIANDQLWLAVANVLRCTRVARQRPINVGLKRESGVTLLLGSDGWVKHKENGVLFTLDVTKTMFSSGNGTEKMRIVEICKQHPKDVIVDLYAGIGFFSMPILVHTNIPHIYMCELNPHTVEALRRNVALNQISPGRTTIIPGDNRVSETRTRLQNSADRVLLGLLPSSEDGWPIALNVLKPAGGTLHIHANVLDKGIEDWKKNLLSRLQDLIEQLPSDDKRKWKPTILHVERVKNFAPHVYHIVVDVEVRSTQSAKTDEQSTHQEASCTSSESKGISPVVQLDSAISNAPTYQYNSNSIPIYNNPTQEEFWNTIYPQLRPAVLRNCDLGETHQFQLESLLQMDKAIAEKTVSVHVCPDLSGRMDFVHKNFVFKSLPFAEFLQRIASSNSNPTSQQIHSDPSKEMNNNKIERDSYFISPHERYYLRALGDNARKETADFTRDFPELSKYFKPPSFLSTAHQFSSVFRVSSNDMQLWTHYDVADNLLCHLVGRKRVVLFPPEQCSNLYLSLAPNSSSSPVLDIDHLDARYPRFAEAQKHGREVILEPGDILFIPAFWFHNVRSLSFAVSVNIFWQQHPSHLYAQKDLYGNKDLPLGVNAMKSAVDTVSHLSQLPKVYQTFYSERIQAILNADIQELSSATPTVRK